VDVADRHAGAEVPAVEINILLVVVQSGRIAAAAKLFFYRDLWTWLDNPFQAPPALAGVHDDVQTACHHVVGDLWTAENRSKESHIDFRGYVTL
jgi:hypothetical protein